MNSPTCLPPAATIRGIPFDTRRRSTGRRSLRISSRSTPRRRNRPPKRRSWPSPRSGKSATRRSSSSEQVAGSNGKVELSGFGIRQYRSTYSAPCRAQRLRRRGHGLHLPVPRRSRARLYAMNLAAACHPGEMSLRPGGRSILRDDTTITKRRRPKGGQDWRAVDSGWFEEADVPRILGSGSDHIRSLQICNRRDVMSERR